MDQYTKWRRNRVGYLTNLKSQRQTDGNQTQAVIPKEIKFAFALAIGVVIALIIAGTVVNSFIPHQEQEFEVNLNPVHKDKPNQNLETIEKAVDFQQQIDEYLFALIHQNSLGEITLDDVHYGTLSPKLISRAFQNQTIYFNGDSVSRYFYAFTRDMLDYSCNDARHLPNKSREILDAIVNQEALLGLWRDPKPESDYRFQCPLTNSRKKKASSSPVRIIYSENPGFDGKVLKKDLMHNRADILFTNFAAYHGMTMFPTHINVGGTSNYIALDKHMMDTVKAAKKSNAKCVFFRTPNPICENNYHSDWRLISAFYHSLHDMELGKFNATKCNEEVPDLDPLKKNKYGLSMTRKEVCDEKILRKKGPQFASKCIQEMKESLDYSSTDKASIQKACSYSNSLTNIGVMNTRQRLMDFVQQHQKSLFRDTGIKLILFDYHTVVQGVDDHCRYSPDGRNYIPLLPLELKVFANIVAKHCA